jgi:hypothetical protein
MKPITLGCSMLDCVDQGNGKTFVFLGGRFFMKIETANLSKFIKAIKKANKYSI